MNEENRQAAARALHKGKPPMRRLGKPLFHPASP